MDKRTQDILSKINKANEREIVKQQDSNQEMRESLKRVHDQPHLTQEQRAVVKKHLDNPKMYETETVIDHKKADQMGADVEREVKRAIHQGQLKDPSKSQEEFMRRTGILK